MTTATVDDVRSALETAGLKVRTEGTSLEASLGSGLIARRVVLDPAAPIAAVADLDDDATRRALTSWARGVYGVLAEPSNSKGASMTFMDAARCVVASLEGPLFAAGIEAAGGEAPWLRPFSDDLVVAYWLELDQGVRVLPTAQVDGWGVHPERVEKAAVSILFHRTRFGDLAPLDGADDVDCFRVGDGYDAGRALILDSWDYHRCRAGAWFATPSADVLLVSKDLEHPPRDAFQAVVDRLWADAEQPLSRTVGAFRDGRRAEA